MSILARQLSSDALPFPLQCHTQQGSDEYHSEENQDRHYYSYDSKRGLVWLGVFDGHAGSVTADFVCSNIVTNIRSFLPGPPESLDVLVEAITKGIQLTESQLHDLNDSSGTCLLLCCLHKEDLIVANVGDSRAILCRKKPKSPQRLSGCPSTEATKESQNTENDFEVEAIQLSNEHNATNQIEAKQARYRFLRNQGLLPDKTVDCLSDQQLIDQIKEVLDGDDIIEGGRLFMVEFTRSLGDFAVKRHCFGVVSPEPEISHFHLTDLDSFLLLASDGVYVTLDNQTAIQLVHDSLSSPEYSPAEILVQHSANTGSGDDLTVLVLDLEKYRNLLSQQMAHKHSEIETPPEGRRLHPVKSRVFSRNAFDGAYVSWNQLGHDTPPAKRLKESPQFAIFEAHARSAQSNASEVHRIKSRFVPRTPVPYSGLSIFEQHAKHHQKVISATCSSSSYKGF
jgi:serine/threonine protein phosphatase PrpC